MSALLSCLLILFLALWPAATHGQEIVIEARRALLVDGETGTILLEQNADAIFNPASMTKLLVAEVVFDALDRGEININSLFKISEQTWRKGGAPSRRATMFASVNSFVRVEDLLRGLIIVQGNDAALALAEGLAGDEMQFVKRMNERVQALGLNNTQIFNVTGLPEKTNIEKTPENHSTARDLLKLAQHIEKAYPHYFSLYGEPAFEWNRIFQRNRNPLSSAEIGADGFVSGGDEKQNYGLVATAQQGKRRLFLVLDGLSSEKQRTHEAKRLIEWGMNDFETKLIYEADTQVARAKVYGGIHNHVGLKTTTAIGILLPKKNAPKLKIRAVYHGPLIAPIDANMSVGHLVVANHKGVLVTRPLITATSIDEAGLRKKAMDGLFEISIGWMRKYLAL